MPEEPCVLVERRGGVGIATLNRPAKLNALNAQLTEELETALRDFDADDSIGAIVIVGAGERAFSAGGDMQEQRAQLASGAIRSRKSTSVAARSTQKPTIAAILCPGLGPVLAPRTAPSMALRVSA